MTNSKLISKNYSYDHAAEDYANQFRDEMDRKPFDRKMLDWLAGKVGE